MYAVQWSTYGSISGRRSMTVASEAIVALARCSVVLSSSRKSSVMNGIKGAEMSNSEASRGSLAWSSASSQKIAICSLTSGASVGGATRCARCQSFSGSPCDTWSSTSTVTHARSGIDATPRILKMSRGVRTSALVGFCGSSTSDLTIDAYSAPVSESQSIEPTRSRSILITTSSQGNGAVWPSSRDASRKRTRKRGKRPMIPSQGSLQKICQATSAESADASWTPVTAKDDDDDDEEVPGLCLSTRSTMVEISASSPIHVSHGMRSSASKRQGIGERTNAPINSRLSDSAIRSIRNLYWRSLCASQGEKSEIARSKSCEPRSSSRASWANAFGWRSMLRATNGTMSRAASSRRGTSSAAA
eukprot:comp24190_c0_seq1/m.59945 comp24190_c0_seq1/g.59945  ORF comp24190_c0_seq1/g.59945 comp24190_c0_seq1/m.59945 type:complete len:361 (+) comp24190_c0_seq1:666-1748(+)